jgi:4-hydroxy-tetrahydrodipicolinate synthase
MFEVVVETAAGRVPVVTGTAEGSTRATIELTRFSKECGADGAVIWPPYFSSYSDDAILEHYRAVADATAFPVIAYNAPEMCGYAMTPDLIARLAESGAIAGLKDSTAQVAPFLQIMALTRGQLPLFQGVDILLFPSLLLGAAGGFSSRANVIPAFVVDLYAKVRAGKTAEAQAMHAKLQALATSKLLKVDLWQLMKQGLNLQGIPVGDVCRPRFTAPFGQAALAELRRLLETFGVPLVAGDDSGGRR